MHHLMVGALVLFAAAALEVMATGAESTYYQRFQLAADEALEALDRQAAHELGSTHPYDRDTHDSTLVDTNNLGPALTNAPVSYASFTNRGELAGIKLGMTMSEVVAAWGKPKQIWIPGTTFHYGEGNSGDLSLRFIGDRLVWITVEPPRAENLRFDNGLTGMMGKADTERLLGAPALRYISPDASIGMSPGDLATNIQWWRGIGKDTYRAGDVRTDISFHRALTPNIPAPKERLSSIEVCFEREREPFFEQRCEVGSAPGCSVWNLDGREPGALLTSWVGRSRCVGPWVL